MIFPKRISTLLGSATLLITTLCYLPDALALELTTSDGPTLNYFNRQIEVDSNLILTHDEPTIDGLFARIVNGKTGDTLDYNRQFGINGGFDNVNGWILTMQGTATVEEYETVLRSVRIWSGNDTDDRTVEFTSLDGTVLGQKTVTTSASNTPPSASDNTLTTLESTPYTFSTDDFGFDDPDGIYANFKHVGIRSFPNSGSLTFDGAEVTANIDIPQFDINKLVFTPVFRENGDNYASFDFLVNDSFSDSLTTYTITFNVTSVNDLPVITTPVRNEVTELEAIANSVLVIYEADDPEDGILTSSVTIVDNDDGYFELNTDRVLLTAAGANLVNSGYALPNIELRVVDSEDGIGSASVVITSNLINDPPVLSATLDAAIVEESAEVGDIVLSFVADDQEHGNLTSDVVLTNNDSGYYTIIGSTVTLTQAAVTYIDAGNTLPDVQLSVTDPNGLSDSLRTAVNTVLINDDPSLTLTLGDAIEEETANAATVVASFVASDEERTPNVNFSSGTNAENFYEITGSSVSLTSTGANFVNAGGILPELSLTVSDAQNPNQQETKTVSPQVVLVNDSPEISLTLGNDVVEDSTTSSTIVASFTVTDEEGSPIVEFTGTTNADGYYQIVTTNIQLSQAGSDYVNAGGSLPTLSLTATDDADSSIFVSANVTPITIILNDKPVLDLVLGDDVVEGTAVNGTVIGSYTVSDEEGTPSVAFTDGTNSEGYYRIDGTDIVLTQLGADYLNTGGILPSVSITATDDADNNVTTGVTRIPGATYVNDVPFLSLRLDENLVEDSTTTRDIVASFVVTDEDGTPIIGFTAGTNTDGIYRIEGTDILLTQAGVDLVNSGNSLPSVSLTATDDADAAIQVSASQTPGVIFVNDSPEITLTLTASIVEDTAADGSNVASFTTSDEDGTPTVDFSDGSNGEAYFKISENLIQLTQAGADHVNTGGELPAISVTATDDSDSSLTAVATDLPLVTFVNDPPSIRLSLGEILIEDSTSEAAIVATFEVSDEDGTPIVDFADDSNSLAHYRIVETRVELTAAGAAIVNGGGELAEFSLIATDDADESITQTSESVTPVITAVNDKPIFSLSLGDYIIVSRATDATIVATFEATDEDGEPIVSFTTDSNTAGTYRIDGNSILLTQAGADRANAANNLPLLSLTASDDADPSVTIELSVQPLVVEDTDLDGIPNDIDTDDDGDGILDEDEGTLDPDNDGLGNNVDLDSDNDGISDEIEGLTDSDGDTTPDFLDTSQDEDSDGIPDIVEGIEDADFDGIPNYLDIDSDGDGMTDSEEAEVSGLDSDGDSVDDTFDIDVTNGQDIDGDGVDDTVIIKDSDLDGKPNYLDRDSDNDYIPDAIEALFDNYDVDGDGLPNHLDQDSDNDGIGDRTEGGAKLQDADTDGLDDAFDVDFTEGTDSDGDGIDDNITLPNSDGDESPNLHDLDSDNDGFFDTIEAGVIDSDTDALADSGTTLLLNPKDTDNDKIPDYIDVDSNQDGINDILDSGASILDTDLDGRIDAISDEDLDGIDDQWDDQPTVFGSSGDLDDDGIPDSEDNDIDGDGIDNDIEGDEDVDGDGLPNRMDKDSDGDGISDAVEYNVDDTDIDNDGVDNYLDTDSDNDGLSDSLEQLVGPFQRVDVDRDGIDDSIDVNKTGGVDLNLDGIDDDLVSSLDIDGDGLLAFMDLDTDGDGMNDDIENGDFNNDGIVDYQQYNGRVKTGVKGGGALDMFFALLLLGLGCLRKKVL